jgi:hypothetical protein
VDLSRHIASLETLEVPINHIAIVAGDEKTQVIEK